MKRKKKGNGIYIYHSLIFKGNKGSFRIRVIYHIASSDQQAVRNLTKVNLSG